MISPRPARFRIPPAVLFLLLLTGLRSAPALPPLTSPDGTITVQVQTDKRLTYDVRHEDRPVLTASTLSLTVDGVTFGHAPRLIAATPRSHDALLRPDVRQKAAEIREHYNELRLDFEGGFVVTFRAYNEGVAYRWETTLPAAEVKVFAEEVGLNFTGSHFAWFPEEQSFYSHNERLFLPRALGDLAPQNLASLPIVVDANGLKVALAESDLEDYPGLWFTGTGGNGLAGTHPPVALKEELTGDRDFRVTEAAGYIAVTKGTRTYPWRILGLARQDRDLLTNQLPWLLAAPSRIADPSWIKPGKIAWDWWNANNLHGVDFKAGVNTRTYEYFIDFAAANGLEYIILDEGWYQLGDLFTPAPDMDVPAIIDYGKKKGVGVILWVVWKTLDDHLIPALDLFQKWGVRGIKVDFMQRSDQAVINFYHRVNREAAARHLLTDFHGAVHQAVLTRTWPNLMTNEGVRGLEWNKWSAHITPEHDATLPFTRQYLGPMDYTPGATRNANRDGFAWNHFRPRSQGTRCHQLALYVVFESPLQMLADTPTNYEREPAMMEFLRAVPSVWDETRALDGRISDYVLTARRSGRDWFVGAITDWTARELELDLSFLPAGEFTLTEWRDGLNAGTHAEDFKQATQTVTNRTKLRLPLAEGGGWAARISPK
ncbi:Retaining alpha-galactosidase precursor [Lacunisphaera limnophila]|uniref:Retaining alpha-galactosidase n=1 Tax=Lacunisphaera limnophila TaxID=1838286 RepID=A0A1D8AR05_9BACT|nr:glycoside hydrolase family 97 protein [Lacunisphaera limnophila]AOS43224.1 Retaining alpha-galactosidase precursor [Lacunisphaera limnophila]